MIEIKELPKHIWVVERLKEPDYTTYRGIWTSSSQLRVFTTRQKARNWCNNVKSIIPEQNYDLRVRKVLLEVVPLRENHRKLEQKPSKIAVPTKEQSLVYPDVNPVCDFCYDINEIVDRCLMDKPRRYTTQKKVEKDSISV